MEAKRSNKEYFYYLLESQLTDTYASAKEIVDEFVNYPEDKIVQDYPHTFNKSSVHIYFRLRNDLYLTLINSISETSSSANANLVSPQENDFGDYYEITVYIPKPKLATFVEKGMEFIKKDLYSIILHEVVHYLQTKSDPNRIFDARMGRGGARNFPAVKDKKKYVRGDYQLGEDETLFSRYMNSWHEIQSYVIQLAEDINIKFPTYDKFQKLKEANSTELYKRLKKYLPDNYLPRINKMILTNLNDTRNQKIEELTESIIAKYIALFN